MDQKLADPITTSIFGHGLIEEDPVDSGLRGEKSEIEQVISDLPQGSALLLVVRGPNLGARFLLNEPVVSVGRGPSSDIFLDDKTVSRKHAEFYALGDGLGYGVRDTGSLNGTYVNRELREDGALANGDEVQIGKYRMRYFTSPVEG